VVAFHVNDASVLPFPKFKSTSESKDELTPEKKYVFYTDYTFNIVQLRTYLIELFSSNIGINHGKFIK
jgi:hypothetical protein